MTAPPETAWRRLTRLEASWRGRVRLAAIAVAIGIWLPATMIAGLLLGREARAVPLAAALLAATLLAGLAAIGAWRFVRARKADPLALVRHLETRIDSLEASGELLVTPRHELDAVARLQRRRAAAALETAGDLEALLPKAPMSRALWTLALGALAAALVLWLAAASARSPAGVPTLPAISVAPQAPAIVGAMIEVTPPAYTGRPVRRVDVLETTEVAVEEAASVVFEIETRGLFGVAVAELDDSRLDLESMGREHYRATIEVEQDRVLQVVLLDRAGEVVLRDSYRRLAMVRDQPPSVEIESPPLVIEVGADSLSVEVLATVGDDYGIAETALIATLALGAGEMVQFREQRFDLERRGASGEGQLALGRHLDLAALGLEPGGELYFFVEAHDNRPGDRQRTRSATHVVRWPGTTRSSVALDAGLPMILPPETFRSQRQIIIDTERLIAERDRLDDRALASRARLIAHDQHALRLRYGGLLGDEFEDGRPARPDADDHAHREPDKARHDEAPGSPEDDDPGDHGHAAENGGLAFGDDEPERTTRLIDLAGELEGDLVHAHDSEESATFFTTKTKATLKSSLANMWEAELQLHLANPKDALPYEYRALRLLKAVQQASRVYVRRVGFDVPPLDPGRRLTGELDDVPTRRPTREDETRTERSEVRSALEALTVGNAAAGTLATALEAAASTVAKDAATSTDSLASLEVLRQALETLAATGSLSDQQRLAVETALWRRLPIPNVVPTRRLTGSGLLWRHYRDLLSETGERPGNVP